MNETILNFRITRAEGRSLPGIRCSKLATSLKGAIIYVIASISTLGVIYYEIRKGAFKKPNAKDWMRRFLRAATIKHGEPVVIV